MADEIRLSYTMNITNGLFNDSVRVSQTADQNSVGADSGIFNVGYASSETLNLVDITTEGVTFLRNLSTGNYVDFGSNDGGTIKSIGRLNAGEFAAFRMVPGKTLALQAGSTAAVTVDVQYLILED